MQPAPAPTTVLITLGAALIAVVGTLLGAWLNQRGAERLSRQTLEGQRALASDAARRDWRRQQIAPFVEGANQRAVIWLEMANAMAGVDSKTVLALLGIPDMQSFLSKTTAGQAQELPLSLTEEQQQQLLSLGQRADLLSVSNKLTDPDFNSLLVRVGAIPDETFRAAFAQVVHAEGLLKDTYTSQEIIDISQRMKAALAALNEAADHYIFSPAEPPMPNARPRSQPGKAS
jgi:hypothetical protein